MYRIKKEICSSHNVTLHLILLVLLSFPAKMAEKYANIVLLILLAYVLIHITRNQNTIAKHTMKDTLMPLYITNIHYGNYSQQHQVSNK